MIKTYKNFSIFKYPDANPESNPKAPSHYMIATDEKFSGKVEVGALWVKEGNYGKFLSGLMGKEWKGKDKDGKDMEKFAYVIVKENDLMELIAQANGKGKDNFDLPEAKGTWNPSEEKDINLEDIPF